MLKTGSQTKQVALEHFDCSTTPLFKRYAARISHIVPPPLFTSCLRSICFNTQ